MRKEFLFSAIGIDLQYYFKASAFDVLFGEEDTHKEFLRCWAFTQMWFVIFGSTHVLALCFEFRCHIIKKPNQKAVTIAF